MFARVVCTQQLDSVSFLTGNHGTSTLAFGAWFGPIAHEGRGFQGFQETRRESVDLVRCL